MRKFWAALIVVGACSAPAQLRDLQEAETHARGGRHELALQSYRSAQHSCHKQDNERHRRSACAAAHLQHAELLVSMGRTNAAIRSYETAQAVLADNPSAAAQASYSAGLLYLSLGQNEAAYRSFWRTITHFPQEGFAADALKRVLSDGRVRAPLALRNTLFKLSHDLAHTRVADNVLNALADLDEHEFSSPRKALDSYDLLAEQYPESGLFDDALWHAARLSRQLGDARGAVLRLRKLLATREVSFGNGSYFSVWLDNAQLELGRVLRDDLGDFPAAVAAFKTMAKDYPDSILKDDALYETAVTKGLSGDSKGACKDLKTLQTTYPDTKFQLGDAQKLQAKLGCDGL